MDVAVRERNHVSATSMASIIAYVIVNNMAESQMTHPLLYKCTVQGIIS